MAKKEKPFAVAVIDIGSNELRLKIAQSGKSKLKYLESLSYPLSLGRDTFDTGKISYEKVEKTCDIIKNFLTVASEYSVETVKAVATTAVREAVNSDYILDQIKIKTGLSVKVMDDAEEKLYIYKLMSYLIDPEYKRSAMMVYIGSGNIGMSVLEDGKIPFIENVRVGSLRLSELFLDIQDYSSEFYLIVEEYLRSFTCLLEGRLNDNIKYFIASGHEMSMIGKLTQAKEDGIFLHIPKDRFNNLYDEIKYKTIDRISQDYGLHAEKAEVLLPAMCAYKNLMEFTKADKIITPLVFLSDSIIYEMLYPDEFNSINKEFTKNTLLSARNMAKRFSALESHSVKIETYSLKIFDRMKKLHGMGSREKLLLQTAAILHDIGKYVNMREHHKYSYVIIKGLDIVGLNQSEMNIVAGICLYHARLSPSPQDEYYSKLDLNGRVLVSKLSAILKIANSLDAGNEQKFDGIDAKISDGELVISISTDKNIELEQWSFNDKSLFFEEVFGIKPVIKKKRVT